MPRIPLSSGLKLRFSTSEMIWLISIIMVGTLGGTNGSL